MLLEYQPCQVHTFANVPACTQIAVNSEGVVSTTSTLSTLAMTASPSLVYHYTTKCQPTQPPFSVRSPMKKRTVQCCIDDHPACASLSHDRSVQGSVSWSTKGATKQSTAFLFLVIRIRHVMVWRECFVTILGVNLWKPRGPRTIRRCTHAVR